MIIWLPILAFYFDGLLSNFSILEHFIPLFSLTTLLLIVPHYYLKERSYYWFAFIYGAFFDCIYTNSFGFHLFFFLFSAILIQYLYHHFSYHIFNLWWELTLLIFCYRTFQYALFLFLGTISFSISSYGYSILYSLGINYIYLFVFSFFFRIPLKSCSHKRLWRS